MKARNVEIKPVCGDMEIAKKLKDVRRENRIPKYRGLVEGVPCIIYMEEEHRGEKK